MLGALKGLLKIILVPTLYLSGYGTMLASIFKEAAWGFYLLVFLIPQPNIWYKFYEYPMGTNFMDFLFFAVFLGIIFQKDKEFSKTQNYFIILFFIFYSYITLWNSYLRFSLPLPITTASDNLVEFKNYAQMISLYFLTIAICKDEKQRKVVTIIIILVILFIAVRSYRNFSGGSSFSYDKRASGPFYQAGLGANHTGAFFAGYSSFCLGIFLFETNKKLKFLCLITVLFSLHPILFSYSRGAYLSFFMVILIMGSLKRRILLVLALAVAISWTIILPESVVDRIQMTVTEDGEIEHSAGGRLGLWSIAYDMFIDNPIVGVGWRGYSMSIGGVVMESGEVIPKGFDTHSLWLKILCEQGIIGISLLTLIFARAVISGWKLMQFGTTAFSRGIGLGFIGCTVAFMITNLFGDRWSYYVLGAYFWICWGLVDSSLLSLRRNEKVLTN